MPVIQDGAITLADSNAILVYLARKYTDGQWLPGDPVEAAEVERWLTVSSGLLEFGAAAARLVKIFNASYDLNEVHSRAARLFTVMEQVLEQSRFLVGNQPTLADIANYSYIAHAPEGDISLEPYPHLRAWLSRIEALPGFVPMIKTSKA